MASIGSFLPDGDSYSGHIATVALKAKAVFRPVRKNNEQAPDFRVFSGGVEIGAAWSMTSKAGRPYLSVKLDDPSFPAPIFCRLVKTDVDHRLVWNR